MVVIPARNFIMGSSPNEAQHYEHEGPQREVDVSRFAMSKYAVTFDLLYACVEDGGCYLRPEGEGWERGNRPVINIDWNHSQEYLRWLSEKTDKKYRLPNEEKWEYAVRAGTNMRFNTGGCITTSQANVWGTNPGQGCPLGEFRATTVPVGCFGPNVFGLHGMHGNVWEWVQDFWNESYDGAPTDCSAWMRGDCDLAMLRGGSWNVDGWVVRSAIRDGHTRGSRSHGLGFRVARSVSL